MKQRKLRATLALVLALLYPLLLILLLQYLGVQAIAYLLAGLGIVRLPALRQGWEQALTALLPLGLAISMVCIDSLLLAKLYPVLMNCLMFGVFFSSLLKPPSVIERIARIRTPDLPDNAVGYTRKVTMMWCGFFSLNGAMALWTVLYAPLAIWVWYNGIVAYVLMGLLFLGEWGYRLRYVQKK